MATGLQLKSCGLAVLIACFLKHSRVNCSCAAGWELFEDSCYALLNDTFSCMMAVEFCNKEGAELVEITSESENNFVADFMKKRRGQYIWMGINDIIQEGQWIYLTSHKPLSYSNWAHNEPDNKLYGSEGCALLLPHGLWYDMPCRFGYNAVCEMNLHAV
ncbi:brevican core protein-like isoform X2 [Pomacea canaliculata]|uniref:brevican core protein-like isoform X2 n=1 Tax=Pomacea canaliculata TaxID=400727 RepID=UPI000D73F0C6|nr:brevican core protein-like isoform X2 [Pomacea canaliculata]